MNRDSSQPAQKKRKLGGIQQRLAKAEAQDKENALKERERLAFSLVTKWAWGHLSPQEVQSTAADAIADMKSFGMEQLPQWLSKFAALGSDGVHPNNMHAELLKMFEPQSSVPKPLVVHLDFKGQHALQSLMLPHELFQLSTTIIPAPSRSTSRQGDMNKCPSFGPSLLSTLQWKGMKFSP